MNARHHFVVDLDGTLYPGNTFHAWLKDLFTSGFSLTPSGVQRRISLLFVMSLRVTKRISHAEMKLRIMRLWNAETARAPKRASAHLHRFADKIVAGCQPNASAFFEKARAAGAPVTLATAAPEGYARLIAAAFEMDDCIATPPAQTAGWQETLKEVKKTEVLAHRNARTLTDFPICLLTDHPDDRPLCAIAETVIWFGTASQFAAMDLNRSYVQYKDDMLSSAMVSVVSGTDVMQDYP